MKPRRQQALLLWLLLSSCVLTEAIEPISTTVAAVSAATALAAFIANWKNSECCQPAWISFNMTGLQADLDKKLFGQHIASRIISNAVSGFMSKNNPNKPLVLSLHGGTGTGKNFICKLIAENIYKEGMQSNFVHMFSTTVHFPHQSHLLQYRSQLQQWIKGNITNCERSMFIFDEMDQMHPGLIDCITPYLDYHEKLDGVSYRKAIFIFLSNAGGDSIAQTALEFWKTGQSREEIKLKDLETVLSSSVFNNEQSGFFKSSLIDQSLVDFFVPLLPLEYKHVVQCAMAEMMARNMTPVKHVAEMVAKDLNYYPKQERVFSDRGCKTVESRLDYYL
ncbi:torsin-1A-like isoform X1 [Solea senegalensis]|uniref:Torsin n=1 Tax=Solea senegalensis TaxID=28829 RepID=A0AAV6Q6G8_SOLSE|nr:torsin-1A-like [Solea senegalensis]KAG7485169.1 torsin-1A-like isoform X1 [Solea senegalensis]